MRLYSRGQLLVTIAASALVSGLAAGALVLVVTGIPAASPSASSSLAPRTLSEASDDGKSGRGLPDAYAAQASVSEAVGEADVAVAGFGHPVQNNPAGYTVDENQNISVYDSCNEAVVNITTEVMGVNWFLDPVPQEGGSGSGSIIDAKGTILTNYHVVKDAYKLFVNFADGTRLEGKVRGVDQENDLAIISFTPPPGKTYPVIRFGDSSGLKVGQKVLAIGNPFALERTLTTGIVSGLGRPVQESADVIIRDMIQTDTAINPGNSGGPLLNSRGEMIGINTMIYSPSGGSVGVGFAVPVNTAKRVVAELVKYGSVRRGWIEMSCVQLFPELVGYMKDQNYPLAVESGLLVSQVRRGSNADRSGLRAGNVSVRYGRSVFNIGGDIITRVDGLKVSSFADLYSALEDNKPGDTVMVEFYRAGKLQSAKVELSDRANSKDRN